jgi:hydrogenase maturation protein HypF
MQQGFVRAAHLRQGALAGGDAAARYPVQAAAGFLSQIDALPDLTAAPFNFGPRYQGALQLVHRGIRTFATTSMGRLFDVAAALLGFVRETRFEGQAAMWLEQMARGAANLDVYSFPFIGDELDFRPLLECVIRDRIRSRPVREIARAFQRGIAHGLLTPIHRIAEDRRIQTVVLSGGVFQNELLLADLKPLLEEEKLEVWTNHAVPPNDGGISLGQAALAAFAHDGAGGTRYA